MQRATAQASDAPGSGKSAHLLPQKGGVGVGGPALNAPAFSAGACVHAIAGAGAALREGGLAQASDLFGRLLALRVRRREIWPRLVLSGGLWSERIGSVWNSAFICR
jgi:hypothetical protein